jgi:hypothetical protein
MEAKCTTKKSRIRVAALGLLTGSLDLKAGFPAIAAGHDGIALDAEETH